MTDQDTWRKNIPPGYDGRFGERFDDEIAVKEVIKVAVGILATSIVALVICLAMLRYMERSAVENLSKPPSPIAAANERHVPSGPLLQVSPEAELLQLREEMSTRLNSYGWTDEGRALIHIPITKAIELVAGGAMPRSDSLGGPSEEDVPTTDGGAEEARGE